MRQILMMLLLLTATAFAGVVGDAEDLPRDFEDEPATGIYQRQRQNPTEPGSGSLKNSVVTDGAVVRTSPQSDKKSRSQRKNRRKGKKGTLAPEDQKPGAGANGSFPQIPGGREAWPLLAIAVLLLVAAGGGGYYFYQQSEE